MIVIDEILVSDHLVENHFVCDLTKCKGACCVEGDFGAPLEEGEIETISNELDGILPTLGDRSTNYLETRPFYKYYDEIEGYGTSLHEDGTCVFAVQKEGIIRCGIEEACRQGRTSLQKPVSCHLYPVRIEKNAESGFEAVNYDRWEICNPACRLGKVLQVPLYRFVKDGLIRKYGPEFYQRLDAIGREYAGKEDE